MDGRAWEHRRTPHDSQGSNARENLTEWFLHRPNEKELSYRWWERAWIRTLVLNSSEN
jgi:hypothetical protein